MGIRGASLVAGVGLCVALVACATNTISQRSVTPSSSASKPSATPTSAPSSAHSPSTGPTSTAAPSATPSASASTSSPQPSSSPTDATTLLSGTNHNSAATAWTYPAKDVQRWIQTPNKGTQPSSKLVFLTFDDGPSLMTPKILDVLKSKGVHATFFVIGSQVKDNEAFLQRAVAEGHAIAIHTFGHNYNYLYPGRSGNVDRIVSDRAKAVAAVQTALGSSYFSGAYRYPGGHMSWKKLESADAALSAQGVYWIDWNAMTGDAEPASRRPTTVAATIAMATTGVSQGSKVNVMLAHDTPGAKLTLESLPQIIDAYKAAGYAFGVIG